MFRPGVWHCECCMFRSGCDTVSVECLGLGCDTVSVVCLGLGVAL